MGRVDNHAAGGADEGPDRLGRRLRIGKAQRIHLEVILRLLSPAGRRGQDGEKRKDAHLHAGTIQSRLSNAISYRKKPRDALGCLKTGEHA